jgi:hypothetical protein
VETESQGKKCKIDFVFDGTKNELLQQCLVVLVPALGFSDFFINY